MTLTVNIDKPSRKGYRSFQNSQHNHSNLWLRQDHKFLLSVLPILICIIYSRTQDLVCTCRRTPTTTSTSTDPIPSQLSTSLRKLCNQAPFEEYKNCSPVCPSKVESRLPVFLLSCRHLLQERLLLLPRPCTIPPRRERQLLQHQSNMDTTLLQDCPCLLQTTERS